jgi:hypothetical protein
VQVFALGIAALGGTLATIHGVPVNLTTTLISTGTAIAAIAQFAVKTIQPPVEGATLENPEVSKEDKG